jgi:hypothetical protein
MTQRDLAAELAEYYVDGMDSGTLMQFAYDQIYESLNILTEEKLHEQVQIYAPHLLGE